MEHALSTAERAPAPARGPSEVVFTFSYLSWDAAARRGWFGTEDRLARGLVEHPDVDRLLVCDRARSLPLKALRRLRDGAPEPFPSGPGRELLSPARVRRSDPSSAAGVMRAFGAYDRAMERRARAMGMEEPVVITTQPLLAGFAELSWARAVTYYALDDWTVHPAYRRWWEAYRESYELIRSRNRRVAAVSRPLLERLDPQAPGAVVANGLEPSEWTGPLQAPGFIGGLARPLLVYAGTLDSRLNIGWLKQAAAALPQGRILLVGPVVDAEHLSPLRKIPNIEFPGELQRAELAGLLRSADLGLIPHRRTALTEAMSPLKLYEYLAAGLPVLASDLEPMRAVSPRIVLVDEDGDFAAGLDRALGHGRADEQARLAFLEEHSWRSRHDELLALALAP
jgi:glycosyltransferase involved in cell wall biosynthesis